MTVATTGLTSAEAARRRRDDGPNALPRARGRHPLLLLVEQLVHFFALMLWVAAALAYVAGMPALSVAIVVVVVLNGAFAFAQEYRADRAAQRLRDLMPLRATVRRDGEPHLVDAADLVVGDELLLVPGARICADGEVLTSAGLAVDESMLTGESASTHPVAGEQVHAGTYVAEGEAAVLVTATGVHTKLAGIAALTQDAKPPRSPLATQLHKVVLVVALLAVVIGVAFFGVSVLLGLPLTQGFLFAVGVTVALVPEGLLPTVTLSLARAAQTMAARHALVRKLDAVETLGATTFICTDKTGTLTRNEMSVVRVWTPAGEVTVHGNGYEPTGSVTGAQAAVNRVRELAVSAKRCSPAAHPRWHDGRWLPVGDPMEVALHVLAARLDVDGPSTNVIRYPFDPRRRRSSIMDGDGVHVTGAPDTEPPTPHTMRGRLRTGSLVDGSVLRRAFGVLGPAEAAVAMAAFLLVLFAGGWRFGSVPDAALLATASGTAFTAVVLGQLANAYACRSATRPVTSVGVRGNRLLGYAVGFELLVLAVFLFLPPLPDLLGGHAPSPLGWVLAVAAIPVVLVVDAAAKVLGRKLIRR